MYTDNTMFGIILDGCLPDDTTLFGSVQLMWPEVGAKENATVSCPCGEIVSIYINELEYDSHLIYYSIYDVD